MKDYISDPQKWSKLRIQDLREFAKSLGFEEDNTKKNEKFLQKYAELKTKLCGKNENGRTAFHWACFYGKSKMVEIIMKRSADFKVPEQQGYSRNRQVRAG